MFFASPFCVYKKLIIECDDDGNKRLNVAGLDFLIDQRIKSDQNEMELFIILEYILNHMTEFMVEQVMIRYLVMREMIILQAEKVMISIM